MLSAMPTTCVIDPAPRVAGLSFTYAVVQNGTRKRAVVGVVQIRPLSPLKPRNARAPLRVRAGRESSSRPRGSWDPSRLNGRGPPCRRWALLQNGRANAPCASWEGSRRHPATLVRHREYLDQAPGRCLKDWGDHCVHNAEGPLRPHGRRSSHERVTLSRPPLRRRRHPPVALLAGFVPP